MAKNKLEILTLSNSKIEFKEQGENKLLHIKAYVLAFGNIDSYCDIIAPTACDKFLASSDADRMALCWQHDRTTVIGKITDKGKDDYGMWIEADILPTTEGKDAAILLKAEAVKEFSIGYYSDEYHYSTDDKGNDIRYLDAITIIEASPVTRAANDRATLVDAKADKDENDESKKNINPIKIENKMTEEEKKAMQESIENAKAEQAKTVEQVKSDLQKANATIEEQKASIDNLDKSAKELKTSFDDLKSKMDSKKMEDYKSAVKFALESKKDEIEKLVESKSGRMVVEFKLATSDVTTQAFGVQTLTGVSSAPYQPNAFVLNLIRQPQSGNVVAWLEGTQTSNAGYIDELAAATANTHKVTEKRRKYAKVGASLIVSAETENWFQQVVTWAQGEAINDIMSKVDGYLYSGDGDDTTNVNHVYGIKGESTAFAGIGTYKNANIADVLLDAIMQVQKAGFTANVAYLSFKGLALLKGLKDQNGRYLYNEATGMMGQLRVIPSVRLSDLEVVVMDNNCATVFDNGQYEIEMERLASTDAWAFYIRKHVQKVTKTAQKGGIIYVASYTAAITAITAA